MELKGFQYLFVVNKNELLLNAESILMQFDVNRREIRELLKEILFL